MNAVLQGMGYNGWILPVLLALPLLGAVTMAVQGIERTLLNKWYVDEAYDRAVVQPTLGVSRTVLWKGLDTGVIDGLFVNGSAYLMRGLGWVGSQLQTGRVGTYAWVLVLGAVAILSAFSFR